MDLWNWLTQPLPEYRPGGEAANTVSFGVPEWITPAGGASTFSKMFGSGIAKKAVTGAPKAAAFPTWAKVAAVAGGVGIAGLGISSLGTKKETAGAGGAGGSDYSQRWVYNPVTTNTTTNTFTTTENILNQNDYSRSIISNSPNATISKKADASLSSQVTPTVTPSVTVTPKIDTSGGGGGAGGAGGSTGSSLTLALIAAGAIIAAAYISKGGKHGK